MAIADQIADNLEALASEALAALCLEIAANLTEACPVDTGHARRNFVPSIGQPHDGEDEGQAQAQGQAEVAAYRVAMGDLYVTNNVPYLPNLIMGSSSQQPAGWDLIAIDKAVQDVQARYGGLTLDVSVSSSVMDRGGFAAGNVADAFSPFGDE